MLKNFAGFAGLVVFLALIVFPVFSSAATVGTYGATSTLGVLLIKNESYYSPFPAEPGAYVDIWISLTNFGKNPVDAECRVNEAFPFSIDSVSQGYKYLGVLKVQEDVLFKYKVRVDEKAVEGYNDFNLECRDKSSGLNWAGAALKIYVQPQDAVLGLVAASSQPSEVEPGKKQSVILQFENLAKVSLKDMRVSLDLSSDKLPFAPVSGSLESRQALLGAGEGFTAVFDLISFPSAVSGVYKIPVKVTYFDKLGKQYSKNETIGLVVASLPEIAVIASSDGFAVKGEKAEVNLKVINKGLSDVQLVWVSVSPDSSQARLLSPQESYVGGIGSDNYETVDLQLLVSLGSQSPLKLPVKVSFRDDSNRYYEKTFEAMVDVFSKEELEQLQLVKKPDNTVLFAIAGLVLAYLAYRFVFPALSPLFSRRKREE